MDKQEVKKAPPPKAIRIIIAIGLVIANSMGAVYAYDTWRIGKNDGGTILPGGLIFAFLNVLVIFILPFVALAVITFLLQSAKRIFRSQNWPKAKSEWASFSLDFCVIIMSLIAPIAAIISSLYIKETFLQDSIDINESCSFISGSGLEETTQKISCLIIKNWIFKNSVVFFVIFTIMQLPLIGIYLSLRKKLKNQLALTMHEYNLQHLMIGQKSLKIIIALLSIGFFSAVSIYSSSYLDSNNAHGEWCEYVEKGLPYHIYVMDQPCILQRQALVYYLLMLGQFLIPTILPLFTVYFTLGIFSRRYNKKSFKIYVGKRKND